MHRARLAVQSDPAPVVNPIGRVGVLPYFEDKIPSVDRVHDAAVNEQQSSAAVGNR